MARRAISILAVLAALPLWAITAPLWVPVTAAVDLITGQWRFPTVRLFVFGGVYVAHNWVGVGSAGALALRSIVGGTPLEGHRRIQGWWAASLLDWAGRLVGVRVDWNGPSPLPEGRLIVLARHASMADAILPAVLVNHRHQRFVHYVLKRELQWDPSLDLHGTRLGNHFVARGGDTEREAEAIEALAAEALPGSALVIFPEGTYATPTNRRRVLESLERRGEHEVVERARRLQTLLPPKPAGTLALLRGQPEADVVVFGHTGLEGVAHLKGLRRRLPLRRRVEAQWWVHRRSELPTTDAELEQWLNERWEELDRWVGENSHR